MKIVVIGVLIASAWIRVNSPNSWPPIQGNGKAGQSAQNTQRNQPGTNSSPSSVSVNTASGDKNQASSPQSNNSAGSPSVTPVNPVTVATDKSKPIGVSTVKDWWDKALVIGTIGLVIVGGFGIAYAIRTLKAIERQAELQEANLAQWVDLKPLGLSTGTTSRTNPPREVTLAFRWRIINNTPFPFTLEKIESHIAIGPDWEVFELPDDSTIPPAKSSSNYFDFIVPFRLTKGQTKTFLESGVALSIATRVFYIDASGYEQEQYFGGWYDCEFPNKIELNEGLGRQATWVRTEKGDPKPDIVLSREKYFVDLPDEDPEPPAGQPPPG